jgi:NADPH:quinone reductase-like Zn-dependent oxidoreductase
MNAAVVTEMGQPPRYQSFPDPEPNPGEALITVRAAGLHPVVKALAAGSHYASGGELPMVPGVDGVGMLEDGTRVFFGFARRPWGTMSERTIATRDRCLPLPDSIDDAVAAAIVNPGMSAWLSIKERAALAPGDTVFISGATGVAGRIAVQVARYLGAKRVIGAGRNVASLEAAGLDAMVCLTDHEDEIRKVLAAEVERGIDVVIDYLWGRPAELLLEALARGFRPDRARSTRWVEVGESAGKTITLPGATLRSIDLKIMGSGFGSMPLDSIFGAIPSLFDLTAKGVLTAEIDRVPLKGVEAAWSRKTESQRIVFIP